MMELCYCTDRNRTANSHAAEAICKLKCEVLILHAGRTFQRWKRLKRPIKGGAVLRKRGSRRGVGVGGGL